MFDKFLGAFLCLFLAVCETSALAGGKNSVRDSLWNEGMELCLHGRFEESNAIFSGIIDNFKLSKKRQGWCYGWMIRNSQLMGDYESLYRYLKIKQSIKPFSAEMDKFETLSKVPQSSVTRTVENNTVNFVVDSLFYEGEFRGCEIKVPVTIGGKEEYFQVDNGCAQYSLASHSFALEHGIRPVGVESTAVGVVDKSSMWLGVADSLSLGGMIFRNIIFAVVPDEALENPVAKITALVGANILRLAGDMEFDNIARTIAFPAKRQERKSNLTVDDGGVHFLQAEVKGDSLRMQLDLGASRTSLNSNYYNRYKSQVRKHYRTDSTHIGGVGGFKKIQVYMVPEIAISTCGGVYVMNNLKITTTHNPAEGSEYGSVGNDFLLSFKKAYFSIRRMFLYVE